MDEERINDGKPLALRFPLYKEFLDTPVEELDLSQGAYNGLKKNKLNTIGELTERFTKPAEARAELRGLGEKKTNEIFRALFIYMHNHSNKEKFYEDTLECNFGGSK